MATATAMVMDTADMVTATAMDTMARGKLRLLLSLAMAMVDMATAAMVTDMAGMDTMATMARGRLRQLLWLLLSQKLLPSLATDTTATEDTEDMVMDTAMDMVTAMATAMARDLRMPTTATEDTVDMVMDTAMATVMDMDTTDKKEGVAMMSRVQWIHNEMDL